jgi:small-conductance mechanosensitive channel
MDLGDSFQNFTDTIFDFLPRLIGFLLILLIGFVIAKIVSAAVAKVLEKVGVDRKLQESDASRYVDAVLPGSSPSRGIGRLVFWLIFVFFVVTAIGALQIPAATTFMNQVLAYLPNVIVAILIFVVAAVVSGAVAGGVAKFMGDTPTGKIVAGVVPALVMVIAFFMILEQLQIAPEIVRIAFAAVMFALALGLALAFGLGGRDLAARLLDEAHSKSREAAQQAKQDAQLGRDRAQSTYESHTTGGNGSHGSADTATTTMPTSGAAGSYGQPRAGDRLSSDQYRS